MMTTGQRMMVEEFNEAYQAKSKVFKTRIALRGSGLFSELRNVLYFSDEDKLEYMRERRTREHIVDIRKVIGFNAYELLIAYREEFAEDLVPQSIRDVYACMREERLV